MTAYEALKEHIRTTSLIAGIQSTLRWEGTKSN